MCLSFYFKRDNANFPVLEMWIPCCENVTNGNCVQVTRLSFGGSHRAHSLPPRASARCHILLRDGHRRHSATHSNLFIIITNNVIHFLPHAFLLYLYYSCYKHNGSCLHYTYKLTLAVFELACTTIYHNKSFLRLTLRFIYSRQNNLPSC